MKIHMSDKIYKTIKCMDITKNNNWPEGRRADNATDCIYAFDRESCISLIYGTKMHVLSDRNFEKTGAKAYSMHIDRLDEFIPDEFSKKTSARVLDSGDVFDESFAKKYDIHFYEIDDACELLPKTLTIVLVSRKIVEVFPYNKERYGMDRWIDDKNEGKSANFFTIGKVF